MRREDSKEVAGRGAAFIGGISLGAVLMYALDPKQGNRRRALARDQASHLLTEEKKILNKGVRDLGHRSWGMLAHLRPITWGERIPDDVLVERVRAQLGRYVSYPRSIEVQAHNGWVILGGPILTREVDELLWRVEKISGVKGTENHLEPHESPENIPGLQGEPRHKSRPMVRRENWPPSLRLIGLGTGLALCAQGIRRGGLVGTGLISLGSALLLRSFTNISGKRMIGVGAGRRAIDIQKTITINEPVQEVFQFWSHFNNFPQFMERVKTVRLHGENVSHWEMIGPGETTITFDTEITNCEPNKILAWRTLPGQMIEHSGIVRFEGIDEGSTRLNIHLSYNPPGGAISHAIAKLFGIDLKTMMDEDLHRMKTLLEEGIPLAKGETVVHSEKMR